MMYAHWKLTTAKALLFVSPQSSRRRAILSRIILHSLLVSMILFGFANKSFSYPNTSTYNICYDGDARVLMAYIETREGLLGPIFSKWINELSGWYELKPHECVKIYDSGGTSEYRFGFYNPDTDNNGFYMERAESFFGDDNNKAEFKTEINKVCVQLNNSLKIRKDRIEDFSSCTVSADTALMPLTLYVRSLSGGELNYTLTFSFHKNEIVDQPLPGRPSSLIFSKAMNAYSKNNFTEAARLFQQQTDAGDIISSTMLGYMHQEGKGVEQNLVKSLNFYKFAADKGLARAQFLLGHLYLADDKKYKISN